MLTGKDTHGLLKIGQLAKLADVPLATLKHYAREGLIVPEVRGRNIAYYDSSTVTRVRTIKQLQRSSFLPLPRILAILEGSETAPLGAAMAPLEQALRKASHGEQRTREDLLAAGVSATDLDWLTSAGIVLPQRRSGELVYAGDDLELLRVLGRARKAGLSAKMLPLHIVGEYVAAIRNLVDIELKLFEDGVLPNAKGDLDALTQSAVELSERLVVLMRRKQLLPALAKRVRESRSAKPPTKARSGLTPRAKSRK